MIDVPLAAPTACDELRRRFLDACARPSSIHQHLTVLRDTASGCRHITELGVGEGWSTLAWLLVQPEELLLVDLGYQPCFPDLERLRGRTEITYWVADSRLVTVPETDLLFIDTVHTHPQLYAELCLHGDKSRRFIALHDTETFGYVGEDGKSPGLIGAVEEWMGENPEWRVAARFTHNNGLTILRRGA